jgi:hypothetical protein
VSDSRQGRIVAELGRPETAQETAARKAEASRLYRARKTVNNLVYSLLATLGVVLIVVLIVPRNDPGVVGKPVDWHSIASQGQGAEADPLLSPDLPAHWKANAAQLRTGASDGIDIWHIGFITPSQQYVGLDQGFHANDTWVATQLESVRATGSTTIGGVTWVVYDNRQGQSQSKNITYGLVATHGTSTVVLSGTAKPSEFETVARALAPQLGGSEN